MGILPTPAPPTAASGPLSSWPAMPASARRPSVHPALMFAAVVVLVVAGITGYRVSEHFGLAALRVEASHKLDLFAAAVDSLVNRYAHVPRTVELAGEIQTLLELPVDPRRQIAANRYLERLNSHIGSLAIFILNENGIVVAASNYRRGDSFIAEDLSFRDYFLAAKTGQDGRHFAVGTTRGDPGYYVSHPIRAEGKPDGPLLGVAVIKISLGILDDSWQLMGAPALIADESGVVLLASIPDWRYTVLNPLGEAARAEIARSRRFNDLSLGRFPVNLESFLGEGGQVVTFRQPLPPMPDIPHRSRDYLAQSRDLPDTGWRLVVFSDISPVSAQATGHTAMAMISVGFVFLLLLYLNQRRRVIRQRLETQALLEQANIELERKVIARTADLTAANHRLKEEVAERRRAEQTLRAAQDELVHAGKLAVLGQLATGITHELTQPLGALRTLSANAIEFMRRGNLATTEKNLLIVAKLVDQMGAIIGPLKTFARKSVGQPQAVDVGQALANVLFLLDQRLRKQSVAVHNQCPPGVWIAWCDPNRLEQVFLNLLGNALDAMADRGRQELILAVAGEGPDGADLGSPPHLRVQVEDSGPGLSEDALARLFEPFFTTKPVGEGLGLGLAISRDILREAGGDLIPSNRQAGGACFTVVLPLAPLETRP